MGPKMLAAAIRKGHTMIGEKHNGYYSSGCGCALGAALAGSGMLNKFEDGRHVPVNTEVLIAGMLGASIELVRTVSLMHFEGMKRLAIADWLETLDVSKPKDAQSFNDFMKVVTQPVEMEAA